VELPIGLDEQIFSPGAACVRSDLGWTDENLVVGYVGRLSHVKGVDLLAAAFRDVAQTTNHVRLLVVGSGEKENRIRAVLSDELSRGTAHIERDVSHDQLPRWYRAMDLLVVPSRYENCSNVVLEGLACGVPVLASDVGGNTALGATGAGWLVAPDSTSSLADCLRTIIANRPELKARGQIASRFVQERHNWMASAERLEGILASRLGINA